MNKQKTEAWVRVLANMVYNYNGSDPKKPPYGKYGVLNAGETLKELLEEAKKQERKRVIKEIEHLMDKKRAKELADNLEYAWGDRYCHICGTNPEKQREKILELLSKN